MDDLTYAGREPFSDELADILANLSRRLLKSELAASAPQVAAAGYWLRPSAVRRLVDREARREDSDSIAAPRGVALHLPPANVDTLFLYSWSLSLLAGNCNVVRLPSTLGPVGETLLREITASLADAGDQNRHMFVSYDHSGPMTAEMSLRADLRLIWGGDAKVFDVSRHPLRPAGLSLSFPDRFSFAAINVAAYVACDDGTRDDLARKFFNDAYWFDQMGCGSPHVLYWVGTKPNFEPAAADFIERLERVIASKRYEAATGIAISKLTYGFRLAAEGRVDSVSRRSNELMLLSADSGLDLRADTHGGGVLAQVHLETLHDLAECLKRRDQTLAHFGFPRDELFAFAKGARARGLSRIVPFGDALSFEPVWDGIDLLSHMTRRITVRTPAG